MPIEYYFFVATLLNVAIFHKRALPIAASGLILTILYQLMFAALRGGHGFAHLATHFGHEWVILANLLLLLTGFALLAHHFEESQLPHAIPRYLPKGWAGAVCL